MKRFTQKQKDDLVQGYLQSEIPCTEYCKQHDLHPNTLYRWKKHYETKPGEQGVKSGENRPVVGYLGTNLEFGTWVDE